MGITAAAQFGFDRRSFSLALRKLPGNPGLFGEDVRRDAEYELGLGSRQVMALADWLRWSGTADKAGPKMIVTAFGHAMVSHDPTLEEAVSWLALHHRLASDRSGATAYWLAFRKGSVDITRATMLDLMQREEPGRKERTYDDAYHNLAQILRNKEMQETAGLIRATEAGYRRLPDPSTMTPLVAAWILAEWAAQTGATTVNLEELLAEDGPFRPFAMSEEALAEILNRIGSAAFGRFLSFSRTAGLDSVAFILRPNPIDLLEAAYDASDTGESRLC